MTLTNTEFQNQYLKFDLHHEVIKYLKNLFPILYNHNLKSHHSKIILNLFDSVRIKFFLKFLPNDKFHFTSFIRNYEFYEIFFFI